MAKKKSRKSVPQKNAKQSTPPASLSQAPGFPWKKYVCLLLTLLAAFTFIFIFDIAGESAGERHTPLLSGTNRALTISIRLENWLNAIPPPALLTWNEPLLKNSLRARVPEAFPEDREAMVFADPEDATLRLPVLRLHFQYNADDYPAETASAILTRLAAAYINELRAAGIQGAADAPIEQINNFPRLFLTLILMKSAAAACMVLFLLSLLSIWLRYRANRHSADDHRLRYTTVFVSAALVFLAGSLGLALCNIEILTQSEYASYPPPSILMGQPISVTSATGVPNPAAEYDWRTIPQSSRYILSFLRREDPEISLEDARIYLAYAPTEARLMRGKALGRAGDWHFTTRVAVNVIGARDAASEQWLSELFWQMKTSYESFLAADGYMLASAGETYILNAFPEPRAHTRARSFAIFGICGLAALGWCAYTYKKRAGDQRFPKSISSRS
ncbi:MAG: hypothetical protein LBC99_02650 [Spirochaetota bacterium]|jgi:hypothetical protein|nr:hypothetical protein [Spirochaetota bacterium]